MDRVLELALAVATPLEYAHQKGVVHRDLKPANVMISDLGQPKILDFGLAMLRNPEEPSADSPTQTRLTGAGVVLGTTAFMSPEQALGKQVDARSDIFSLGALLYELATGQRAFAGATTPDVLDAVLHQDPVPVTQLRPDLPGPFEQIVAKALRKDRRERYQSMADLVADLRHLTRQSEPRSGSSSLGILKRVRRGWLALGVLVVGAGVWLAAHGLGLDRKSVV